MIDFKKELQKYRPVRTMDDFRAGSTGGGDFTDIVDCLKYILAADEQSVPKKHKETDIDRLYDTYK